MTISEMIAITIVVVVLVIYYLIMGATTTVFLHPAPKYKTMKYFLLVCLIWPYIVIRAFRLNKELYLTAKSDVAKQDTTMQEWIEDAIQQKLKFEKVDKK